MSKPMLLIQETVDRQATVELENELENLELIAIAVYGKDLEVPLPVATQRIFDGESKFKFPTEITAGAMKTRIVYRYTLSQWQELLEITTIPGAPAGLKQIMIPMLLNLVQKYPAVFAGIEYDKDFDPDEYAETITMN